MKPVRKNVMFLPEKDCKNDSVMYNNSQKGFWPTLYIGGDTMYLFLKRNLSS